MCGRYRLTRRRQLEIEQFYGAGDVDGLDIWERQFNIPPREMAPIVLENRGRRRLTAGFWSLMPPWAETLDYANKVSTFNAKAETLTGKPTFRNAFLKRRCIVPAEAFYEWIGPRGKKQPLHISRRDGKFLSMAGLFNFWRPKGSQGRPMPTFTVVTILPNNWMARIHNRMPAFLQEDQIAKWLDLRLSDPTQLSALLAPPPEEFLDCFPVNPKLINSGLVDTPECIEPIDVDFQSMLKPPADSPAGYSVSEG
jgi:putative SOS response-associated peptidase YedK